MLENPRVRDQDRFNNHITYRSPKFIDNACDVCNRWEAQVKFNNTKLCSDCSREEGIEIL